MSREAEELQAALTANDSFYKAFAAGDLDAMNACWSKEDGVLCTHPGWRPLHGRDEVMDSWHRILGDGPPSLRWSDARVSIVRGVAFVSCIEWLMDGTLVASNVFVWEEGCWKLVHHHASPLSEDPHPEAPPGRLH